MVTGYSNVLTHLVRANEHTLNLAHAARRSTRELFGLLFRGEKRGYCKLCIAKYSKIRLR